MVAFKDDSGFIKLFRYLKPILVIERANIFCMLLSRLVILKLLTISYLFNIQVPCQL